MSRKTEILKEILTWSEKERKQLIKDLLKSMENASFTPTRSIFRDLYKQQFKTEYYWQVKDSVALKQILRKIEAKMKEQNLEITADDTSRSFKIFVQQTISLNDEWILNNFTLPVINSQFNSIYVRLKNKGNGAKSVSDNYKRRIFDDLQS